MSMFVVEGSVELLRPEELTNRQLALANYYRLVNLEQKMTELSQAVSDLQASVAGVSDRLLPQIQALQSALSDSQAAQGDLQASLDQAIAADVADDADFQAQIDAQKAALDEANASAAEAANSIETEVGKLNQLGQPAEEPPVDPNA